MALAPTDIKVAGHWKSVDQVSIKIGGHWKPVGQIMEKVAGHWKHIGTTLHPPLFTGAIGNLKAEIGQPFTLDVAPLFSTGPAVFSYSIHNAPAGMVISNAGVITWPAQSTAVDVSGVSVTATNAGGFAVSDAFGVKAANFAFITTWRTAADGDDVVFPISRQTGSDAMVDWGDGSAIEHVTGIDPSHTYAHAGDHDISVTGSIKYWSFPHSTTTDKSQFIGIKNWGNAIKGGYQFFANLPEFEFITATDQPDFNIILPKRLLENAPKLVNVNISHWVFQEGASCDGMFHLCALINFDATWPGFKPGDTDQMFNGAAAFTGDLSTWDVSVMSPGRYFMGKYGAQAHYPTAMYDKLLIAWGAQTVLTGKIIGFVNAKYTPGGAAEAGRSALIAQGWTIDDAGPVI